MKTNLLILFLLILFLIFIPDYNSFAESNDEIVGKVNSENLYLSEFNRLLKAQKKKFHQDLNFDLFSPSVKNPKSALKREEQLKEINKEGLIISNEELDKAWQELITSIGSLENLENKAKENSLLVSDIKQKLEENMLLEKYFKKHMNEKVVERMINEILILQEAKSRNLKVSEGEIIRRLNLIKEKQGGEEGFTAFLSENNATIDDAKNEIKDQILYELVKNSLLSNSNAVDKNNILKLFISEKKSKADIVIYTNKLSPQKEQPQEQTLASEPEPEAVVGTDFPPKADLPVAEKPDSATPTDQTVNNEDPNTTLRLEKYPTITKSTIIEEAKKLEDKTNNIIAEEIKQKKNEEIAIQNSTDTEVMKEEKRFKLPKFSLSKVFNRYSDAPLLNQAQKDLINSHIKQNIPVEESGNIAEQNKPKVLEPLPAQNQNTTEQIKKAANVPLIKLDKEKIKRIGEKLNQKLKSEPTKVLKEKFNKLKLVILERKQKQEASSSQPPVLNLQESIVPGEEIAKNKDSEKTEPQAQNQPAPESKPEPSTPPSQVKTYSVELNDLNVFKKNNSTLQNIQSSKDLSKELDELRKKIDTRRVTVNQKP
ncbi:MAG: SurA N-terminal domain-containing protein [Candidatus Melainabacteria bacterium]|nr:SurA N-terminal domain-containing protein [Candidatus Melainabacteria bacterium]